MQLLHAAGHKVENRILSRQVNPILPHIEACAAQGIQHLPLCCGIPKEHLSRAGQGLHFRCVIEGVNGILPVAELGTSHYFLAFPIQIHTGHQRQAHQLSIQIRIHLHHAG